MDLIRFLADPATVAKIQNLCGVDYEKPLTCDQQTQTRRESSDSNTDQLNEHTCWTHNTALHDNSIQKRKHLENRATCIDRAAREESDNNADVTNGRCVTSSNNLTERNNNGCVSANYTNIPDIALDKRNKHNNICYQNGEHIKNGKTISLKNHKDRAELYCSKDDKGDDVPADVDSSPLVTPAVIIKYKCLLYLARFGAFLGNELFYLTFFPFLIWNLDFLVVRQVSMLWCVVMYLGQATKDLLRWPRPGCPPVVRLEVHYTREYSMPSTHAMAGTAIPLYLAYLAVERYQVPMFVAGPLALMWFSVTCWSRLYLGVHTILDLLVGCVYALVIFFTFLGYVQGYDLYQQTHPFGAPVLLFTALTMCTVLYPTHYKNSSKADAVQIVSAYTGLGIGSWLGYQLGYMNESDILQPYFIPAPTLNWCVMASLRFITGLAVLAFLYTVTKWWSVRFYSYIYGLDEPDKTHPGVMTAYKFTTYAVVGAGAALFAPLVHLHLNIHRPSLFYEVL